ncbi:MAG: glycosyltransferase family A protein [Roseibacillus sp.]
MKQPLSIIIPTVNRGELFRSPLESVVSQLEEGDELIISINGPREPVLKVLEDFEQELAGVELKLVWPESKLNIYQHWNFVIRQAKHRECVFVHDDEIYHSRLLAIAREEFLADQETTLVTGGHIRVIAPQMKCFRTIAFTEREEFPKAEWVEAQKNAVFPKYGCTAYIFRRQLDGYSFFEQNTRVSDALLMYSQSMSGKVVQRPEFFGTRLLHAENTSHTDYLEPGHRAYWEGLAELARESDCESLVRAAQEAKESAAGLYSKNALHAALPRGDRQGFEECLRQIKLAGGAPTSSLKILSRLPLLWAWGPVLFQLGKALRNALKPKYEGSSGTEISSEELESDLELQAGTWKVFCARVGQL